MKYSSDFRGKMNGQKVNGQIKKCPNVPSIEQYFFSRSGPTIEQRDKEESEN
jgi:hypothetical protein